MKPKITVYSRIPLLRVALGVLVGLAAAAARAQGPLAPAGIELRAEALKQALATSSALFAAKKNAEAEQALFAANRARIGTAAWNLESAGALLRIASRFSSQGDTGLAREIALRALQYTSEAERVAAPTERGTAASARELTGYIYERYMGDAPAARRSYEAAVILAPRLSSAQEALDRLTRADEIQKGRRPGQ